MVDERRAAVGDGGADAWHGAVGEVEARLAERPDDVRVRFAVEVAADYPSVTGWVERPARLDQFDGLTMADLIRLRRPWPVPAQVRVGDAERLSFTCQC